MGKKMWKLTALLTAAMVFASGCGGGGGEAGGGGEGGGSTKDTLVVTRTMDPGSMQPYDATGTAEGYVQDTFLETLFFYDEEGVAQPKLAESYEYSEDGMAMLIKIREGVKFHNGDVMDMDDVLYSFST